MAPGCKGKAIVVMGVSGAGKSYYRLRGSNVAKEIFPPVGKDSNKTIGQMLAEVLSCCFIDADDYHPQTNKEKMRNGIPLSDEDRIPWLETLRDALRTSITNGKTIILGCSALQQHYREILRSADQNYEPNSYICAVKFVLLHARAEVLAARLEKRAAEGKHFMPAKLLQSQIDLLQIDESEGILKVDAILEPQTILNIIQTSIVKPQSC